VRNQLQAQDVTVELLDSPDPPTAILGGYNRATIGAIRALRRLDGEDPAASPQVIPTRLIPRGSGEIAAP
jgi:DNA-binding LacI/PurR family transcriptional regulator